MFLTGSYMYPLTLSPSLSSIYLEKKRKEHKQMPRVPGFVHNSFVYVIKDIKDHDSILIIIDGSTQGKTPCV